MSQPNYRAGTALSAGQLTIRTLPHTCRTTARRHVRPPAVVTADVMAVATRCAGADRNPASRWAACPSAADARPGQHPKPCSGSLKTARSRRWCPHRPRVRSRSWAPSLLRRAAFGGDIDNELSGGFRGDYGVYLTDNIGVGGRIWFMANNNDSYYAEGDGSTMSIGRPFFNTSLGLCARKTPSLSPKRACSPERWRSTPRPTCGGAEAYSRLRFSCTKSARLDFIGGYSHFEINDQLAISSTTITNATARNRTLQDLFETKNRFDGGQVGFEMVMRVVDGRPGR